MTNTPRKYEPCAACPTRRFHMPECSGQVPCTCGLKEPLPEWACGMCEKRRFHLSSCAVFNEPAMPAGPCDCGLKVPVLGGNYCPSKTAQEITNAECRVSGK